MFKSMSLSILFAGVVSMASCQKNEVKVDKTDDVVEIAIRQVKKGQEALL